MLDGPGSNFDPRPKASQDQIAECIKALLSASLEGRAEEVELLWRYGCRNEYFDGIEAMQAILETACSGGHVAIVDWALKRGASIVKAPDPLDMACWTGQLELFKRLLYETSRGDVKAFPGGGAKLLLSCLRARKEKIAWLLLQSGAGIEAQDGSGQSALALACGAGFLEMAQYLYRIDASARDPETRADYLANCLVEAARNGRNAVINWLVGEEVKVDPNFQDRTGRTVLHRLCANSAYASTDPTWVTQLGAAFELLLSLKDHPADPHLPDSKGRTPLMLAAGIPGMPLAGMLFDPHALNAQDSKGRTALAYAVSANRADAVEQLVDCGANPFVPDEAGNNLLMAAAQHAGGDLEIMRYLLQKGLRPDDVNINGDSTAHSACRYDNLNAVKLLWKWGANFARPDEDDDTPFLKAGTYGASRVVAWLLKKGIVSVHEHDSDQRTVLHLAAAHGCNNVVEVVLPYGPDLDAVTDQDETPAICAVISGSIAVLECLRQAGANLRWADGQGNNALDHALLLLKYDVAQWLLEWGISPNRPLDEYAGEHGDLLCRELLMRHGRVAHVPVQQVSPEQILALPLFSGAQHKLIVNEVDRWSDWLGQKGCSSATVMRLSLLPDEFIRAEEALARSTFACLPQEPFGPELPSNTPNRSDRALGAKQRQYLWSLLLSDPPSLVVDVLDAPQLAAVPDFRHGLSARRESELHMLKEAARQALAMLCQSLMDALPTAIVRSIKIDGELNQSDLVHRLREELGLFRPVADCLQERILAVHRQLRSASVDLASMGSLAQDTANEASVYRANFMQMLKLELQRWNLRHAEPALLRTVFLGDQPKRNTNYLLHQWQMVCSVFGAALPRPLASYLFAEGELPGLSLPMNWLGSDSDHSEERGDDTTDAGPRSGGPAVKPQGIQEAWSPQQDLEFVRQQRPFAWSSQHGLQRIKASPGWLSGLAQALGTGALPHGALDPLHPGMLPGARRLLQRQVEGLLLLCSILWQKPGEHLPQTFAEAVHRGPELAQRDQVLNGLLRLLPALSEEENLIWKSELLPSDKTLVVQWLTEDVASMRRAADQAWIASISRFAQEFPRRVVQRLSFEGEFEEDLLSQELARDFGLFEPVLQLLMEATRLALQARGQGAADLPRMGTRGTVQRARGERYLEFMDALRQQLQQWFAPEPGRKGEPYPLPASFRASFRQGLKDLSGASAQARDAYVDLVWGQWWSVRDALSAGPLESKVAGTDAPPPAGSWVFPPS